MKIFNQKWKLILLLAVLYILTPLTIVNAANLTDAETDVPVDKMWTITFNYPVIESSVTSNSIYVVDRNNIKQDIQTIVNDKVVTVYAPVAGYAFDSTYTLHIETDVLGQVGNVKQPLNEPIIKPFTTTKGYAVVTINSDGTQSSIGNYATFDEANTSLQQDQGIMLNDKYIKIPAGFVATNLKAVTIIYKQPTFTAGFEYAGIATDTELVYVDATANYVTVRAAGQDMYVKHEDVTLIPNAAADGQSYYIADEKGLWHRIYHQHSGKYDSAYLVGKKPAFLNEDVKYYSVDGATFTDENDQLIGESYAYFQYVSPRVPTSYSADQLNRYIENELEARERTGNAKYANATVKSPLKGLGATLKTIEQDKRINALLILSLAIHESDYGMSCHAQNYNNLFGLNVIDSNSTCSTNVDTSSNKYFTSIEENITALVNRLNTTYLDPLNMGDFRYNGSALGNKMIGLNVRYASDPYWGAKTAGHMHRIDQALGSNDYQNYKIGITSIPNVSIRTEPIVKNGNEDNRAYQYRLDWTIKRLDRMPITLSNTLSEEIGWLRVVSELPTDGSDLYTVTENVRPVTTH